MLTPALSPRSMGLGVAPLLTTNPISGRTLESCLEPGRPSWLPTWILQPNEIACLWGAYPELGKQPYTFAPAIPQPVSPAGHAPESALVAPYVPSAGDILAAQRAAGEENIANLNAAIDAAAAAAAEEAGGGNGECGFFCEFKKYGTGAVIGAVAIGGVFLFLMLKK